MSSNRNLHNTKKQKTHLQFNANSPIPKATSQTLRKNIISKHSSNLFQNTFHHQNSYMNHDLENSRDSPYNKTHHNNSANEKPNPLIQNNIIPIISNTNGNRPLPRFGQSLLSISPVKLLLFGGAVGDTSNFKFSNETFLLNLMTRIWSKIIIDDYNNIPKGRAAHAASSNDEFEMVIHGGSIGGHELAEDELWLFELKKDNEEYGSWRKINHQSKGPGKRYGHTLNYMKPYFILFGGSCHTHILNDLWIIDIKSPQVKWIKIDFKNNVAPSPRLYQTCGFCNKGEEKDMMLLFGGRDSNENALNDIWGLTHNKNHSWSWTRAPITDNELLKPRYNHSIVFYGTLMIIIGGRSNKNYNGTLPIQVFDNNKKDIFDFPGVEMNRHNSFIFDKYIFLYGGFNDNNPTHPIGVLSKISIETLFHNSPLSRLIEVNNKNTKIKNNDGKQVKNTKFKLSHNVVIGSGGIVNQDSEENEVEDMTSVFTKVNIEQLKEENKRIGENSAKNNNNYLIQSIRPFNSNLVNKFIDTLLRPFEWFDNSKMDEIHKSLPFKLKEIYNLIKEVSPILEKEKSLIRIRSPCKIFGNIYGDYNDLMRFFESFGNPSDDNQMGDINVMQYVFLGDFCDRCHYSLEIIFLLFALKIKYPNFIYLIRGHHEDISVNINSGLGQECKDRLDDDITQTKSLFFLINKVFDLLPFGVLVDNNILCVHGGIGSRVSSLDDIENIKRPFRIVHEVTNKEEQIVLDLLYSEYSNETKNIEPNKERDIEGKGFIVKYGEERLNKFLIDNKIVLLITSHKFCKEGILSMNNDRLLSIFSSSNYMDKYNNYGGMIIIGKKTANKPINIIPRLIDCMENKKETYRQDVMGSPVRDNF